MYGLMGSLLKVSLSSGKIEEEKLPQHWKEGYLGGRGVGVRILWQGTPPGFDLLGEENMLVFATS